MLNRNAILAAAVAAVVAQGTFTFAATDFDTFTPVAPTIGAGSLPENAPFLLPAGFSQVAIANKLNQVAQGQSVDGAWDMQTVNETGPNAGRYLFAPFETGTAGVQRIDLLNPNYNTRTVTIVAPGTQGFVAGDASRWTPFSSYLTGEESWGTGSTFGRLFEVTDPTTASANSANFVQRTVIPRVSHEGLAFDTSKSLYFVDELNGGSVYKYVPTNPNAVDGNGYFGSGQTFALKVGAGGQFEGNSGPTIVGTSTWQPITNATGGAIAGVSTVLGDGTIDGRVTADHATILGTGYNRPEDLEIQNLPAGGQVLYFTTTDSDNNGSSGDGRGRVYSLNLTTSEVKLFADNTTINSATGAAVGTVWSNPDNLAIDNEGNIYAIEDQAGGVANIWFAPDADKNGVADSVSVWATLSTAGAEPTGLYFDPFDPNVAYVNVQHPSSGDDYTIKISVPEPASLGLLSLIGGMFLRRKR